MFSEPSGKQFAAWPDKIINGALMAAGLFLIVLAFVPGERILKTIVLAYVLLP